jgi:hypothetical protein
MRLFLPAAALTLLAATSAAASNRSCLACHTSPLFDAQVFAGSVHGKLDCADCHRGYDFDLHRAAPPAPSANEKALTDKIGNRSTAPAALSACGRCHESQVSDWTASVHGRWVREKRPAAGPVCLDCHGSAHAIVKQKSVSAAGAVFAERCLKCHEDPALVKSAGLSAEPGPGYRDSVHGRLHALGSPKAPVCSSCHGAHDIAEVASADSMVNPANKAKTCAECHKGATDNFAATFTHQPLTKQSRPIPYWTMVFFSFLTSIVLTLLVVHVLLDFGSEVRRIVRKRRGLAPRERHLPAGSPASVQRFDRHQLVQHWILIASVITLAGSHRAKNTGNQRRSPVPNMMATPQNTAQ